MQNSLIDRIKTYFRERCGIAFDALVAPIDAGMPSGRSVRGRAAYHTIEQARRQDDASLPMNGWEHDLKRADWDKVASVATDTLARHSKDLQIAVWLLEAQIHKDGFAGVAPCILLLQVLCERYWDDVHPQAEDGDMEYRANVIRWADRKLLAALRLAPVTAAGRDKEFTWADWEQSRRNEQVREKLRERGRDGRDGLEGPTGADVLAAMGATPLDAHAHHHAMLGDALDAIQALLQTLDERLGDDAPGLMDLSELLQRIRGFIGAELHKRGYDTGPALPAELPAPAPPETQQLPVPLAPLHAALPVAEGTPRDRAQAYAMLAQAADCLLRIEPHSPVPYLIRRATEWGALNTAQLYEELFLKLGGQLNIFDMLGLEQQATEARER
jgi:type VI secretion system protein ImpA